MPIIIQQIPTDAKTKVFESVAKISNPERPRCCVEVTANGNCLCSQSNFHRSTRKYVMDTHLFANHPFILRTPDSPNGQYATAWEPPGIQSWPQEWAGQPEHKKGGLPSVVRMPRGLPSVCMPCRMVWMPRGLPSRWNRSLDKPTRNFDKRIRNHRKPFGTH